MYSGSIPDVASNDFPDIARASRTNRAPLDGAVVVLALTVGLAPRLFGYDSVLRDPERARDATQEAWVEILRRPAVALRRGSRLRGGDVRGVARAQCHCHSTDPTG